MLKYYDMGFMVGQKQAEVLQKLEKDLEISIDRNPDEGAVSAAISGMWLGLKASLPVVKLTLRLTLNPLNHIALVKEMATKGVRATLMSGMEGSIDGMLKSMYNDRRSDGAS